jgi:methylmalonyl-CoA/ethylmalonyl-CoA epimerase
MIKGIYGINIAVKDLDEATKKYEKLFGVKAIALGPGDFAFPGLTGAKLDVNGTFVNLISYSDENSSVAKFLNSKGEGVFLLSVEVDNVDSSVEELKDKDFQFIFKKTLKGDFGEVNFVHPKSAHGVQLEIYRPER